MAILIISALGWLLQRGGESHVDSLAPSDAQQDVQLKRDLDECRLLAAGEPEAEPDWTRAAQACGSALDRDPIHPEANALYRSVEIERQAAQDDQLGKKALARFQPEEALQLFAKIPASSHSFRKSRVLVLEATERLKKKSREDCAKNSRARRWNDSQCPTPAAVDASGGPNAKSEVRSALTRRFQDPSAADALVSYWDGKTADAIVLLEKLLVDPAQPDFHSLATQLKREISLVDHLFKAGQSALQANDPERALPFFEEALQYDRKLMGDLSERHPSFFNRNLRQEMARQSYHRGKHWADRADLARACRIWRLGHRFYRGNPQLLKALRYCTEKARERLQSVRTCSDLDSVLGLAVPGDGLRSKALEKRSNLRCP